MSMVIAHQYKMSDHVVGVGARFDFGAKYDLLCNAG